MKLLTVWLIALVATCACALPAAQYHQREDSQRNLEVGERQFQPQQQQVHQQQRPNPQQGQQFSNIAQHQQQRFRPQGEQQRLSGNVASGSFEHVAKSPISGGPNKRSVVIGNRPAIPSYRRYPNYYPSPFIDMYGSPYYGSPYYYDDYWGDIYYDDSIFSDWNYYAR